MKRLIAAGLSLAVMLAFSACGASCAPQYSGAAESGSVTFKDDLGSVVTVADPQRVAVTMGSFADIWCLAGGKDTLVAASGDSFTDFDLDLPETVADLGAVRAPDMEVLLASDPDLIIASSNIKPDLGMKDTLEQAGIPVVYFDASTFGSYLHMLDICTKITGFTDNFTLYGEDVQKQVEAARARATGAAPSVLYVRVTGSSCDVKNSEGTVLGGMLSDLGCRNIADSDKSLLENLSMEAIVADDPDYIFVVMAGDDEETGQKALRDTLLSNPAWSGLTAVREGRFHVLDRHLYHMKPNEKWGEAYEKLADILYPEKEK